MQAAGEGLRHFINPDSRLPSGFAVGRDWAPILATSTLYIFESWVDLFKGPKDAFLAEITDYFELGSTFLRDHFLEGPSLATIADCWNPRQQALFTTTPAWAGFRPLFEQRSNLI